MRGVVGRRHAVPVHHGGQDDEEQHVVNKLLAPVEKPDVPAPGVWMHVVTTIVAD